MYGGHAPVQNPGPWSNWGSGCDGDHGEQQLYALRKDGGVSLQGGGTVFTSCKL